MKIRAKANGNIVEASDEEAKELVASGVYEFVDEDEEKKASTKRKDVTAEPLASSSYKRRDLRSKP